MQVIGSKIDNSPNTSNGVLTAEEFNSIMTDLQNIIGSSGQTQTGSNENQLAAAIAQYCASGDYFTDSGSANTYVLSTIGSLLAPYAYTNGMQVRFFPANASTGASTVNVAGLGTISIKRPDGSAIQANDIPVGGLVELTYNSTSGYFILSYYLNVLGNQTKYGTLTFTSVPECQQDPADGNSLVRYSYLQSYVTANIPTIPPRMFSSLYHGSSAPIYGGSTSITIQNLAERDITDSFNILLLNGNITVSTSYAGLNGLDNGSVANNTFYNLYAVSDGGTGSSHNGFMLSTVNSMVSGTPSHGHFNYSYYRQLPFVVLINGSGAIVPFYVGGGWPNRPEYFYNTNTNPTSNGTVGVTQILSNGTASSYTVQSCSSYVPAVSQQVILNAFLMAINLSGPDYAILRQNGLSTDGYYSLTYSNSNVGVGVSITTPPILTDASQQIQYKVFNSNGSSGLYLAVQGFVIDQVS